MTLQSLGIFLDRYLDLSPNMMKNPEFQEILAKLMKQITENSDFEDRLKHSMGNDDWGSFFTLFLILCEFGKEKKISAYDSLIFVIDKHKHLASVIGDKLMMSRVFKDSVSDDRDIRTKALVLLMKMAEDREAREVMIESRLVSNLFRKVALVYLESFKDFEEIVARLSGDKEIWMKEGMEEERGRVLEISKRDDGKVLKSLAELIK